MLCKKFELIILLIHYYHVFVIIDWYIGSEPSQTDILPRLDVSYNDAHSASLRTGVLYLDGLAFSNISDLTAIADGTDPSTTGPLYFEPGRPFFHTLEFCTFAHNCETSDPRAAIVISKFVKSIIFVELVLVTTESYETVYFYSFYRAEGCPA